MPIITEPDFSWLPSTRSCGCPEGRLNCLSREETYELGSTVLNVRKRQVWKESHPARFVPQLPEKYIRLFSHEGETVLDPFCGSGTTNVVAAELERNSIGIDVNSYSTGMSIDRLDGSLSEGVKTTHQIITGDSRRVLQMVPEETIDLVVTSPPYFNVVDYDHQHADQIGNIEEYDSFLDEMQAVFQCSYDVLKKGGFAVVNTQDLFKKAMKCPIHSDYIRIGREAGFQIYNINIYILNYSTGGRLVYGYPKSYYPKNDHEYILIFRKSRASQS